VACLFQLGEQHLLVAQAIGKQLLRLQLLPPGPDHWADAEQRQLAWGDQAGGHGGSDAPSP
jgi:hypothetical protein